jgi:putative membrane protein
MTTRRITRNAPKAHTFIPNPDDVRISNAIHVAEAKTSGEIVAVVASESDSYLYAPILWAALAALAIIWPLVYFTWMTIQWIAVIQLLIFVGLALILSSRPLRYRLVPRATLVERAHARAVEQFLVQNLHTTAGRTGVLIFVSVAERYAEILADAGIHNKVPEGTWQTIVDELTSHIGSGRTTDGFVHAIERVGKHLAQHFPPGSAPANALPNHLIVLN